MSRLRRLGVWALPREFSGNRVVAFLAPTGAIAFKFVTPPTDLDLGVFRCVRDEIEAEARERAGRR